jgi:hypothetical protein
VVLQRTQVPRLVSRGVLPVCVLVLVALCTYGLARAAGPGAAKPSASNERLRELLTQRYEILQHAVKDSELTLKSGEVDVPTLRHLTIALFRAQADLCTTDADRVQVYEKFVEAMSVQEKLLEGQFARGLISEIRVDEGKVATLNARIDLERLRLGQPASRQ